MPLIDLPPYTLRMVFAAAAADNRNALSAAMRGAILSSLQRPAWVPDPQAIPQTWALVEGWYKGLDGNRRQVVQALAEESRKPDTGEELFCHACSTREVWDFIHTVTKET